MDDVEITGYVPGAIGRVTELHAAYYYRHWGFDLYFEAKVARELAEFLGRINRARDLFLVAWLNGLIAGSISVDGSGENPDGARLRWFIVAEEAQGHGIGRRLMREAVSFCQQARLGRVHLWTFAGLDAAARLYREAGFSLVKEHADDQWGKVVTEQMFARDF